MHGSNRMKRYSEEEITEAIELAKEVGMARAIRELGYPTFHTLKKWATVRGINLELNQLSQFSNDMKKFYGYEEKVFTTQLLMDRIQEALQADDLGGDELKKLSESLKRAVETMNLLEGKATSINQTNSADPFDNDMTALLEEQERINRAKAMDNNN